MIGRKIPVTTGILISFFLGVGVLTGTGGAQSLPLRDSVLSTMHYVDSHFIQRWPTSACASCLSGGHAGNIWTRGVYFEGHMALYQMAPDSTLYAYATTWGSYFNWAFNGGNGGANANGECAGQAYGELYQADTTQKIRILNDTAFVNGMKRGSAVNYWTWIDAIHMAMATFAEVGAIRNDTAAFTTMHNFFEYPKDSIHKTGLWDTVTHLWFRDSTFLSPAYGGTYLGPDGLPCFWSRGNGWVISALCRTLNYLPVTDVHRAEYVQIFQQMCAALLPIQRSDGFWNMDLGDPNNCGGPEETGTGCFTYAMAWGINHGFLDTATYLPAVVKGWHALDSCVHPMSDTVVLGWVQGSGDAPSQSPAVTYAAQPNFDDYGVGIFLLAGSEVYNLAPALPGVPTLPQPSNGALNQPTTVTLSWSSVPGASTYGLQVSTVSTMASTVFTQGGIAATRQSTGGLASCQTYFWQVNATNAGGTGSWSAVWSFTTMVGAPLLCLPSNGALNQPTTVTLSWNTTTGASNYTMQVSTISDMSATFFQQTGTTSTSQSVSGLANSAVYFWQVSAANAGGSGSWSAVWSFTTIIGGPVSPMLSLPSNGASGLALPLTLSWAAVPGAASYGLQMSTVTTFSTTAFGMSGITATSYAATPLPAAATCFYWRVNAANIGGIGPWSSVWSCSTLTRLAIPLAVGWNIVSLNVTPPDSSTAAVFGDSLTQAQCDRPRGMIVVKNLLSYLYWPLCHIDGICTVHTGQGYQIYSDSCDTMQVQGVPVADSITPLSLSAKWNLIGFLPQGAMPVTAAFSGIVSKLVIAKNNAGQVYWPDYGINNIGSLEPGAGYFLYMNDSAVFTYPASAARKMAENLFAVTPPAPRHYVLRGKTGNSASVLVRTVTSGGVPVADGCEIGAFNGSGGLVGSGTVAHGSAAFAIWGRDRMSKSGDGCADAEKVAFRLWDGKQELPLDFVSAQGAVSYAENGVFLGAMSLAGGAPATSFNLSGVFPNPFRQSVRVAFDVPAQGDAAGREVAIDIYDLRGNVVCRLAHGSYPAGHYTVSWDGGGGSLGQKVYILRMRANTYEKRMTLYRVR